MAVDKSNWDPAKCQATSKKRGDQCKNYPVRGLRVCLRHGGGSKKARAAASRNLEQEKLTRVARRLEHCFGEYSTYARETGQA